MAIAYEMSEQDFMDARKLAFRHLPNRRIPWIFRILSFWGLFLILAFIWNIVRSGVTWNNGLITPLVLGLLFLSSSFLMNQAYRAIFRKNAIFRGRRSLAVDETGLAFTAPTLSVQLKWASIQSFVEDDTSFVLYQSGLIFHILPKRELSPGQIADLREAFTRNIVRKTQNK
jgi:YcxB-like protein